MISVKSEKEMTAMRISNRIVAELLQALEGMVTPGINTLELDRFADDFIRTQGAVPAFKGYTVPGLPPYPAAICASVNSCIVHGIPSDHIILREGDIIGIDVGVYKDGFYGDSARTYRVGKVSAAAEKLLQTTRQALEKGIKAAREDARVGDISHAIGSFITSKGYYVADNLTGHGIGRQLHEEPMIPNIGFSGKGPRLKRGMTIAIEPMVNIGTNRVVERGWEFFVADDSLSAHFEHTVLITGDKAEILSSC
ncbi:MAG: type I methionyl aminopeptidase [Candidatus Cloacimonetes bacterium]|nr:type I methionyl aminopeptidase [Candidatus Cloacimonadota bacterium]